jgi:hypothetical protein
MSSILANLSHMSSPFITNLPVTFTDSSISNTELPLLSLNVVDGFKLALEIVPPADTQVNAAGLPKFVEYPGLTIVIYFP